VKVQVDEFRHRKVMSFGQCIYCGKRSSEVTLTDEHIVPYSLGGTNVLQKASCRGCASITSGLELHLARNIFGHHRVHANVATRNRKNRPSVLPSTFQIGATSPQKLEFPIKDHPYFTMLPVWGLPGMLTGATPAADFGTTELHRFEFVPKHFRKLLKLSNTDTLSFLLEVKMDQDQFARAVAKIAYCEAIARFGLNGFERTTIVDFILGRYPFSQFLVGGTPQEVDPPMPKKVDHAILLIDAPQETGSIVIGQVRLFANTGTSTHGMPWYLVILGARLTANHNSTAG